MPAATRICALAEAVRRAYPAIVEWPIFGIDRLLSLSAERRSQCAQRRSQYSRSGRTAKAKPVNIRMQANADCQQTRSHCGENDYSRVLRRVTDLRKLSVSEFSAESHPSISCLYLLQAFREIDKRRILQIQPSCSTKARSNRAEDRERRLASHRARSLISHSTYGRV